MTTDSVENIQKEVLELYEKAWKLEKESIRLGIRKKKKKSEIFLAREILEILIEIQDDYSNDGSSLSHKLKEKKINLIEKYIFKLKSCQHIEMLTDYRNRNVFLLLITLPCKQTLNCLNHLISLNCDINSMDNEGHNGCHIACEFTNINALKLLYKYNINLILKDHSCQQLTPLHIAIDILISSQKDANSQINTHKYAKMVKLCSQYALLQGQDIVNDKLGKGSGQSWNFKVGSCILDVAMENIHVLEILTQAYNNCCDLNKECKKIILRYNKQLNETMVELIWSFMYYKLPRLALNKKLKKAKQRMQKERMKRRESMRNTNKKIKKQKSTKSKSKSKSKKSSKLVVKTK